MEAWISRPFTEGLQQDLTDGELVMRRGSQKDLLRNIEIGDRAIEGLRSPGMTWNDLGLCNASLCVKSKSDRGVYGVCQEMRESADWGCMMKSRAQDLASLLSRSTRPWRTLCGAGNLQEKYWRLSDRRALIRQEVAPGLSRPGLSLEQFTQLPILSPDPPPPRAG